MKILYLTPGCFDKGGISRYSRYQIRALRELFGTGNVRALSLLAPCGNDFEEKFDVHWHGNGTSAASKFSFAAHALAQCLFWKPDVIHTAHVNLSGLSKLLAKLVRGKTILNTYGLEVWSGLSADALWGLKRSDLVLSDCHATADYIVKQGWRPRGVPVLWDCVDLEKFAPGTCREGVRKRYGIPRDGFIILTLGRLARAAAHKGYERLLEVFARMISDVPDAVLVFAGRGDMQKDLEIKAKALGLSARVVFTGSVDEADLPDLYRAASVFSLVSDRANGRGEGIPLTPLEAMACGIPILVGNQDGSREAVVDSRNGKVLYPFDLDAHAQILIRLARNADLRNSMAVEAALVARELFTYEHFLSKHREIYKQIRCP